MFVALVLLLASGCGSGNGSATGAKRATSDAPSPGKQRYIASADRVCKTFVPPLEAARELARRPVTSTHSAAAKRLASALNHAVERTNAGIARLQALHPPQRDAHVVGAWIAQLNDVSTTTTNAAAGLQQGALPAFLQSAQAAAADEARAGTTARRYGLVECGRLG